MPTLSQRIYLLARDYRTDQEHYDKMQNIPTTSPAQKKLPLTTSEVPPFPWHTLGTYLFYWKHQDFLVVGDYFSKFLIVRKLPNSSTNAIVKELSMIFTEFERSHS